MSGMTISQTSRKGLPYYLTVAKATTFLLLPLAVFSADRWISKSDDNEMIYQTAMDPIKDEYGLKDLKPQLKFYCSPEDSSITASINWKRFISSFSTEVGFKIDAGKFLWLKWRVDDSEQITYSPSVADTEKLIKAMNDGETLLVDIAPYSEAPITVNFDLNGFSAALEQLKKSCR